MTNKKEHQQELQQAAEILAAVINGKFSDRDLWSAAKVFDAERSASCGWGETPHVVWDSGPFDWAISAGAGWGDWAWLDEAIDALGAYVEPYNGSVLGVWEVGPALAWDDQKRSDGAAALQTLEARLLAREFEVEFANEIGGGSLELDDGIDQITGADQQQDQIEREYFEVDPAWQEIADRAGKITADLKDLRDVPGESRSFELLKLLDAADASKEILIKEIKSVQGSWRIYMSKASAPGLVIYAKGPTFYAALEDFDLRLKMLGVTKFTF